MDVVWPTVAVVLAVLYSLVGVMLAGDVVRGYRALGPTISIAGGMVIALGFVAAALLVLHWAAPSTG
jgi:hypothetical protein